MYRDAFGQQYDIGSRGINVKGHYYENQRYKTEESGCYYYFYNYGGFRYNNLDGSKYTDDGSGFALYWPPGAEEHLKVAEMRDVDENLKRIFQALAEPPDQARKARISEEIQKEKKRAQDKRDETRLKLIENLQDALANAKSNSPVNTPSRRSASKPSPKRSAAMMEEQAAGASGSSPQRMRMSQANTSSPLTRLAAWTATAAAGPSKLPAQAEPEERATESEAPGPSSRSRGKKPIHQAMAETLWNQTGVPTKEGNPQDDILRETTRNIRRENAQEIRIILEIRTEGGTPSATRIQGNAPREVIILE